MTYMDGYGALKDFKAVRNCDSHNISRKRCAIGRGRPLRPNPINNTVAAFGLHREAMQTDFLILYLSLNGRKNRLLHAVKEQWNEFISINNLSLRCCALVGQCLKSLAMLSAGRNGTQMTAVKIVSLGHTDLNRP